MKKIRQLANTSKKPQIGVSFELPPHTDPLSENQRSGRRLSLDEVIRRPIPSLDTIPQFLKTHTCDELVPLSSKLIVFDSMLNVKKAFYALIHNEVRAALIWSSPQKSFIGVLTITDFIRVLLHFYKDPKTSKDVHLEDHNIQTWRDMSPHTKPFATCLHSKSVFDAIITLQEAKIHRLPIVDPSGNALSITTHKRILKFLHLHLRLLKRPQAWERSIEEERLGTWDNLKCINPDDIVYNVLQHFVDYRVSAFPILDSSGFLIDVYSKFDVLTLAANGIYPRLHQLKVRESIMAGQKVLKKPITVSPQCTISILIEKFVRYQVHRLFIVEHIHPASDAASCTGDEKINEDQDNVQLKLRGVVSLSDLLSYLITDPKPPVLPMVNA